MRRAVVFFVLALLTSSIPASADQDQRAPRIELGASAGTFVGPFGDGFILLAAGPRLSFNVTERLAVELIGDVVGPLESSGLYGLYEVQVRHFFGGSRARRNLFVTAGTAGGFSYQHFPEHRETRRDGSVVVYPAHTRASLSKPAAFSAGIGVQHVVARHLALRAEAQALIGEAAAIRGSFGVSFPIGGSYVVR